MSFEIVAVDAPHEVDRLADLADPARVAGWLKGGTANEPKWISSPL
jgi:hypothetical protein